MFLNVERCSTCEITFEGVRVGGERAMPAIRTPHGRSGKIAATSTRSRRDCGRVPIARAWQRNRTSCRGRRQPLSVATRFRWWCKRAKGAGVWDGMGNEYLDFMLGFSV